MRKFTLKLMLVGLMVLPALLSFAQYMSQSPVQDVCLMNGATAIYSETSTVTDLGGLEKTSVIIPTWVASEGNIVAEVTVNLSGDENPANDMFSLNKKVTDDMITKKPLYEVFTSSTCAPCLPANEVIDGILGANPDEYTLIKYQMNWPGPGDPYYTAEGGVRRDYYGVISVPDLYINSEQLSPANSLTQEIFDDYATGLTSLEIEITEASIDQDNNLTVTADLTPLADYDAGLSAYIVVVEKLTVANVGTNGETEFHNVMMKMLPDSSGTTLDALTTGVQVNLSEAYNMDTTNMETPNDLAVVVFVQDETDKSIVQSAVLDVDGTFVEYEVDITIEDMDGNPIEGAYVMLEGYGTLNTDTSGMVLFTNIFPGIYAIDAAAGGFIDGSGSVSVIDQNESVTIALDVYDYYYYEMFDFEIPATWTTHATEPDNIFWSGGYTVLFRVSATSNPLMLVSEAIDVEPANMIYFDAGVSLGDSPTVFGIMTDPTDPSTFTGWDTIYPPGPTDWETYEYDLSDIDTDVYFAWSNISSMFTGCGIDNVILTEGGSGVVTEFFDDFESGINNWEVTGAWGLTDEYAYSSSNSLTDSPGGNYLANQEIHATMVTGVDLSDPSILSADVNWWMIMDIENGNFDYLYVQVSTDDFASFTQIASFFGEGMLDPWVEYSYSLGAFLGNDNVKVRFHFSSDGGYEVDGCYIDDFSITTSDIDNAPPEVFFDAPFAYEGSADDYVVEAEIIDATGVTSAEVIYAVDGVAQLNVVGVNVSGNDWEFTIPQQEAGYQVDFVINAIDSSPASNEATTDTASYIAGEYIGYDNALVDFYTEIGPDGSAGLLGTAVVFTIEDPSRLVTALIRNYTDQSVGPNDEMVVHVWSDGGGGPGVDLIDPITIMPEANLVNTTAFTRIDLRDYEAQLGSLEGDVFVGFTVPSGVVRTTISQPGIANRSFQSADGSTWTALTDDYHYRIVLGPEVENLTPAPTDLTAVEDGEDIVLNWVAPNTSSDDAKNFLGYNVYYSFEGGSFDVIAEEITETTFTHVDAAIGGLHTYYVTAFYDEGESLPSNEVDLLITSVEDQIAGSTMIYPNPASEVVNIKSDFDITSIKVFNHSGQVIADELVHNKMYQFNTSQYNAGMYFFQIETTEGTISKRIIVQ